MTCFRVTTSCLCSVQALSAAGASHGVSLIYLSEYKFAAYVGKTGRGDKMDRALHGYWTKGPRPMTHVITCVLRKKTARYSTCVYCSLPSSCAHIGEGGIRTAGTLLR